MSRLLGVVSGLVTLGSAIKEYSGHTSIGQYLERRGRELAGSLRLPGPRVGEHFRRLRWNLASVASVFGLPLILLLALAPLLAAAAWMYLRWIDFPVALAAAGSFYLHAFRQQIFSAGPAARLVSAGRVTRAFLYGLEWILAGLFLYLLFTSSIIDLNGSGNPDLAERVVLGVVIVLLVGLGDALKHREPDSEIKATLIDDARWMTHTVVILSLVQATLSVWQLVFALQAFGMAAPDFDDVTRMGIIERTVGPRLPRAELEGLQRAQSEQLALMISWAGFSFLIGVVAKIKSRVQWRLVQLEVGIDTPHKVLVKEQGTSKFYKRFAAISLALVVIDVLVSGWLKQFFLGSCVLVALGLLGLGLDLHKWCVTHYVVKAIESA